MTKATVSVEEAASVLGVGRGTAYRGVRNGDIPSIKVGKRILVPVERLNAMLAGSHDKGATAA